jgi:hypothetical protein
MSPFQFYLALFKLFNRAAELADKDAQSVWAKSNSHLCLCLRDACGELCAEERKRIEEREMQQ